MTKLIVNECRATASQRGAEIIASFRKRFEGSGRIEVILASVGGDLIAIACDSECHAHMLRHSLAAAGVPDSAMRFQVDA